MTRRGRAGATPIFTRVLLALAAITACAKPAATASSAGFPRKRRWLTIQDAAQQENAKWVRGIDTAKTKLDLVLYGDSIILTIQRGAAAGTNEWHKVFGEHSAALGVVGMSAEDLAWRLMKGGELPKTCPKVVALYVGLTIANLRPAVPASAAALERLVKWLKGACPHTQPVVMALLQASRKDTKPYNVQYKALASRQHITYAACGQSLSPRNASELYDGEHPTSLGQNVMIRCLYQAAKPFLQ